MDKRTVMFFETKYRLQKKENLILLEFVLSVALILTSLFGIGLMSKGIILFSSEVRNVTSSYQTLASAANLSSSQLHNLILTQNLLDISWRSLILIIGIDIILVVLLLYGIYYLLITMNTFSKFLLVRRQLREKYKAELVEYKKILEEVDKDFEGMK